MSQPDSPRVVDVVFAGRRHSHLNAASVAVTCAVVAHGLLWLGARSLEPSLESWSTEIAARVHAELTRQEVVELAKPTPPPPPVEKTPDPPAPPRATRSGVRQPHAATPPPPPAEAARIIVQEPVPDGPVDLTGDTFVTGNAARYSGGTTAASRGNNPTAVSSPPRAAAATPTGPDRSRPVSLDNDEWRCAWPAEADAERIDEQTVVLRVFVLPDGSVESARLLSDPGRGFGKAAIECAKRTSFSPALDRDGRPVRSESPPIRVRFTR